MEALTLIAPLSEGHISTNSYILFHYVMQAPVSLTYSEEKKWEASRLALHGAYKQDKDLPFVEDPRNILTFLNRHFELAAQGENQDEPIRNALHALAHASNSTTIEALNSFDLTEPSFVHGIRHAFQKNKPLKLREAVLSFLSLIGDKWFNTCDLIMGPGEMRGLCEDWSSAVDEVGLITSHLQNAALTVLFGMINSQHWRPHIPKEKWKLLEHSSSVPHDSEPLRRCLDNLKLMHEISEVGNRDAEVLWSTVLRLKYKELTLEVREQLEDATKAAPRSDIDRYLGAMDSEEREAEGALAKCTMWFADSDVFAPKTKLDNLRETRALLVGLVDFKKG